MMKSGIMFEQGDIVIIPFPFTDLSAVKQRPVLIISNREYNHSAEDIVVCGITSNLEEAGSPDNEDDCAYTRVSEILTQSYKRIFDNSYNKANNDAECLQEEWKWASNDGNQYLCANDNYWHKCSKENEGLLAPASYMDSFKVYECTLDEYDQPLWQQLLGVDMDHDGYTTSMNDCDDDSSQDPSYCSDLETPEDCGEGNVQNAKCSICINPSMEEICGDTFDNDCNAETSDDCHKNKEACEESFIAGIPVEEAPPTEEGTEPAAVPGSYAYNIYRESFSWIPTEDGGYCCGYQGITDLGIILEAEKEEGVSGNFLCLNQNEELVGSSA